ncbi:hypothetical protein ACF0H5_007744 [Mactra antiquata]
MSETTGSAAAGQTATSDRRSHVMVGELPNDFLRFNSTPQQQQAFADERVAQILQAQQQAGYYSIPPNIKGRLNISIVQAKLNKNYGMTRMDPYCRVRVGHAVFETPTAYNGAKNPQWCKDMQCYLPNGVDNMYVEIFDEKSFTSDDRVAWSHVTIPNAALNGETVDEWFPLSGKQGEGREGTLNLVITFTPVENIPQPTMQTMVIPQIPAYPGVVVPGMAYPPQQRQPGFTEEDFKQVKDMFPNMDDEIIRSVFVANSGNKDTTINSLLQMSAE